MNLILTDNFSQPQPNYFAFNEYFNFLAQNKFQLPPCGTTQW